jgi:hypothetical protein
MGEQFEEWRVTGTPGGGYPIYDFVWSPDRNPHLGDPEEAARHFVNMLTERHAWKDGPHLWSRRVARGDWENIQ